MFYEVFSISLSVRPVGLTTSKACVLVSCHTTWWNFLPLNGKEEGSSYVSVTFCQVKVLGWHLHLNHVCVPMFWAWVGSVLNLNKHRPKPRL